MEGDNPIILEVVVVVEVEVNHFQGNIVELLESGFRGDVVFVKCWLKKSDNEQQTKSGHNTDNT